MDNERVGVNKPNGYLHPMITILVQENIKNTKIKLSIYIIILIILLTIKIIAKTIILVKTAAKLVIITKNNNILVTMKMT